MPVTVNQDAATEVDETRARLRFWLRLDAARLLWPSRCLVCDAPGSEALDLCPACASELPWNRCACPYCAIPLPAPAAACGACLQLNSRLARQNRAPPLTEVHATCVYATPIDRLLPRFKFHHDLAAGALLSQLMAEACASLPRPDALIAVPLHRTRLRRRGYDQALELARPLARALALPLLEGVLQRRRATTAQSELSAAARRRNLRNAFGVRAGTMLPAHVVLVDDVMTTGATLHAAADALIRAGAARVDAWVCARVP